MRFTSIHAPPTRSGCDKCLSGQRDPRYLAPNHLGRFVEDIGVELRTVKIRMRELIDRVNRAIDKMGKGYDSGFFSTPIVTSILRVIEQRERKMKSLL